MGGLKTTKTFQNGRFKNAKTPLGGFRGNGKQGVCISWGRLRGWWWASNGMIRMEGFMAWIGKIRKDPSPLKNDETHKPTSGK